MTRLHIWLVGLAFVNDESLAAEGWTAKTMLEKSAALHYNGANKPWLELVPPCAEDDNIDLLSNPTSPLQIWQATCISSKICNCRRVPNSNQTPKGDKASVENAPAETEGNVTAPSTAEQPNLLHSLEATGVLTDFNATDNRVSPFLVWTQSRSGSEWFMDTLSLHPEIFSSPMEFQMCPTESMNPLTETDKTCYASSFFEAASQSSTIKPKQAFEIYLRRLVGEAGSVGGLTGKWGRPKNSRGMVAQGFQFSHDYLFNEVASYSTKFNVDAADAMESVDESYRGASCGPLSKK